MNRYWVGGTGNWNDTSHWSASSGGSGGASVPTSNDDVFIDSNSGLSGGTILVPYGDCNNLTCTSGHTYTIKEDDYGGLYISGSLELGTLSPPLFRLCFYCLYYLCIFYSIGNLVSVRTNRLPPLPPVLVCKVRNFWGSHTH